MLFVFYLFFLDALFPFLFEDFLAIIQKSNQDLYKFSVDLYYHRGISKCNIFLTFNNKGSKEIVWSLPEASVVEGVDRLHNRSPVMLLEVYHEIRPE